uniref:FHA domain-containing protein n=1 Tax=Clastoptera arizonana TaxID=38151 RepID=A0A1B6DQT2_9HEMI
MWLMKNDDKGQIYKINRDKDNIVSRKEGDLLLLGDQSISRQHAALRHSVCNQNIILRDLGSKYGTFIKQNKGVFRQVKGNEDVTLHNGDIIRFGIQSNCWMLEYIPIVVTTSTLGQEEKAELCKIIASFGGTIQNNWSSECTHLVMNQLTVTVKVVCGLATCRPIVTLQYWKRFTECINKMKLPLPEIKDYTPKLIEATLNSNEVSFLPNMKRQTLFTGVVFIATTSRQLGRIEVMITSAGGKVEEFGSTDFQVNRFLKDGCILMMHSTLDKQLSQESQIPAGYKRISKILKSQGVRCIPESDIGLSILYCSREHYCNPYYKGQQLSQQNEQIKNTTQNTVSETEDNTLKISDADMEVRNTYSESIEHVYTSSNIKRLSDSKEKEESNSKKPCHNRIGGENLFSQETFEMPLPCIPSTSRSSLDMFLLPVNKESNKKFKENNVFSKSIEKCNKSKIGQDLLSNTNLKSDIFGSVLGKNKNSEDLFSFPLKTMKESQSKKRNRCEDSELDFGLFLEEKKSKFSKICEESSINTSFHNDKVLNNKKEEQGLMNTKDKYGTENVLQDEYTSQVHNVSKFTSFSFIEEDLQKHTPLKIPLSSFICKTNVKKELIKQEEFSKKSGQKQIPLDIEMKCLVLDSSLQKLALISQSESKSINFKTFKKKQTGITNRPPCIIGGNDFITCLVGLKGF